MKIYIVKSLMSSPNFILGTKWLDEITQEVTYKFKEETRKKIGAIRMTHKQPIYRDTLDFHGLFICREDQVKDILASVERANVKLRAIDPILHASVMFIPLDLNEIQGGELYGHIINSIRFKIYKTVFDKLDEVIKRPTQLKDTTHEAMLNLVTRLRNINVLNDEEINTKLDEIYRQIEEKNLKPLREELLDQITDLSGRVAYLEM